MPCLSCIYERQTKESIMSKIWMFIGGMLTGVASVFVATAVAVALEEGRKYDSQSMQNGKDVLALPEGEDT